MMKLFVSAAVLACASAQVTMTLDPTFLTAQAQQPDVVLATFDGAKGTTFKWRDSNDPVMGGSSTSSFNVAANAGVFNGTCAIVKFLKAPGFAKVSTEGHDNAFADVSKQLAGGLQLRVRSTTPAYKGFRVAFAAKDIPRTSMYGGGSFKSGFELDATSTDWQVVTVPFSSFSYDWSGFTGRCDTKDPSSFGRPGKQHHCCGTGNLTKYCPTAAFLGAITDLEIWAEGVVGDFQLEVQWLGASDRSPRVCKDSEYCCPDAKKCLTPTKVSCSADANACTTGQVCCPLTKICVVPGLDCSPTPQCDTTSYCCPDAKACLTPTHPGDFCDSSPDAACADGQICCPLTKICVKAGAKCTPE